MTSLDFVQHLQTIPFLLAHQDQLRFAHPPNLPYPNRNILLCANRNFSLCSENVGENLVFCSQVIVESGQFDREAAAFLGLDEQLG